MACLPACLPACPPARLPAYDASLQVRSLDLDIKVWTRPLVHLLSALGNEFVNAVWEAKEGAGVEQGIAGLEAGGQGGGGGGEVKGVVTPSTAVTVSAASRADVKVGRRREGKGGGSGHRGSSSKKNERHGGSSLLGGDDDEDGESDGERLVSANDSDSDYVCVPSKRSVREGEYGGDNVIVPVRLLSILNLMDVLDILLGLGGFLLRHQVHAPNVF